MARLILLYTGQTSQEDTAWADQFVAANDEVKEEKKKKHGLIALDRGKVALPKNPSWKDFLAGVDQAAKQAGQGGVVMLLGGHSASGCFDRATEKPAQMCDVAGSRTATVWLDPGKKLRFDEDTVFYDVKPPYNQTPRVKDQETVADPKKAKTTEGKAAQARLDLRSNYYSIGFSLYQAGVKRFVFLSCAVGNSKEFLDKVSKDWRIEVAAYKYLMALQLSFTTEPGKKPVKTCWMYLKGFPPVKDEEKRYAKIYIPSLKTASRAYVSKAGVTP